MSELEEWQNTPSASDNSENGGREGYRSYNRENTYGNRTNSYNRGDRPQRPRFNRSSQPAYSSNSSSEGFRPSSLGGGDSSERPSYNRGGYNSDRRQGGYNSDRRQGGYNSDRRQGGYNSDRRQGGYNSDRGGYNSDRRQGGYNNDRGGYSSDRRQGGYNSDRRQGGYNNDRGGYNNNRGGYNNNRGGYNNNRQGGGYNSRGQRPRTADYNPNAKYSMKKQIEYKEYLEDPNAPIRLNKYLANAGVCSRREADQFIQAGVVTVNGEIVTELGTKVQRTDSVHFHDQLVSIEKKVYVILNKPKDYVTTSDDPQQRKTVMDLVKNCCRERIYPVGRLDRNTTGVLLFTNDGELASKLTHPKFLKKKIYHVYLDKNCAASDLQQISEGIELDDGPIRADAISYASDTDKKQVGIEIHSGKNRIVRRIFEHLGYKVCKLDRVMFAGLTKKGLKRGDWRFLTEQEVAMLHMGSFE